MKYLKLFENQMLDTILDKIAKNGMDSLTSMEKEFLDKFSRGEHKEIENKIKEKDRKYKGTLAYDPRKDDDFYKELGSTHGIDDMSFKDWSDEEIEDGKYLQLWDQLYDEDMDSFLRKYAIPDEMRELPWGKLHKSIRKLFKTYIKDIGMLD